MLKTKLDSHLLPCLDCLKIKEKKVTMKLSAQPYGQSPVPKKGKRIKKGKERKKKKHIFIKILKHSHANSNNTKSRNEEVKFLFHALSQTTLFPRGKHCQHLGKSSSRFL